jgi:hypothetical protein
MYWVFLFSLQIVGSYAVKCEEIMEHLLTSSIDCPMLVCNKRVILLRPLIYVAWLSLCVAKSTCRSRYVKKEFNGIVGCNDF